MEIAKILENKKSYQIYGLLGNINITTNNNNYSVVTDYKFNGTVKDYLNNKKDNQALKIAMLNESYLTKKVTELSESEIKKVSLAKALIDNKNNIVLDYFEKGLNFKEKDNYKRLFKKLTTNYKKTITIFTNDISFIWDIITELIIVDKNEVINTIPEKEIFDILNILDPPEITKFINLMRDKSIKVENYKEWSDLLKAIYRIVGD